MGEGIGGGGFRVEDTVVLVLPFVMKSIVAPEILKKNLDSR